MNARNRQLDLVKNLNTDFLSQKNKVGEFISIYIKAEIFAKKLQIYYKRDIEKSTRKWQDENLYHP